MSARVLTPALMASLFALTADAGVPLDLSPWTALTLDLPGGQGVGSWSLTADNTTVTQTINADPSFYLNGETLGSYTMNGSWQVVTTGDDDLIGFAFGYQDTGHTYIFDWKRGAQDISPYGFRDKGFVIRKMHGNPTDMVLSDYWSHEPGQPRYTILATEFGPTLGWAPNQQYTFSLEFEPGEFTIRVTDGALVLWDVTVQDSEYLSGQFGFYNNSQAQVRYSGFTQNLLPTCDAGGPYETGPDVPTAFDGTGSVDVDGDIVSYEWNFGDGETGTGAEPVHAYSENDTYTVELCVTDDAGETACCETTILVDPSVPIEVTSWGAVKDLFR